MKNKITWFWNIDRRLWGDDLATNRYMATITLMFAMVLGALAGGGTLLSEMFGWNISISYAAAGQTLVYIWGYNVAESVIATDSYKIMVLRSLLLLVVTVAAVAIGALVSAVVIIGVILWLGLMIISAGLSGGFGKGSSSSSSSSEPQEYGYDENGSQHRIKRSGGGYGFDEDGRRWKNESGSKWSPDE